MGRRLLNLAVLLSAVLCLLLAAVWVRSYFVEDFVRIHRGARRVQVFSLGGQVAVITLPAPPGAVPGVRWTRQSLRSGTPYSDDRVTAFWRFRRVPTRDGAYTVFPHWPAVAAAGLPAGAWYALRVRARRRSVGAGTSGAAGEAEQPSAAA